MNRSNKKVLRRRFVTMKKILLALGVVCALAGAPLFAQEAETDEEEQEPTWKGSLGLAWVATSGNTDTSSAGVDFAIERKPEPWGLSFEARGTTAQDSGVTTAENYLVGGRAVRSLGKRWEAFGGLQWSKDPFAGFDSQTVVSVGGTYLAVESTRHRVSFDMGVAYTWEDQIFEDQIPSVVEYKYAGGLFGVAWEWKLGENSTFTEQLVYYPNFDDSADWRMTSVTAIEAAINSWLALRASYDLRHRNQPIDDADSTDATSTVSVVFNF
jgi:putative salt-induced outer membrane protein